VLFILDTDLLTVIQWQSQPAYDRLQARLQQQSADSVCTTIVSVQELVRGRLAEINRARSEEQVVNGYKHLHDLWHQVARMNVLPFERTAHKRFIDLRSQGVRIGTRDLRISCIALETGATVLSRNLRDFQKVPELRVEDWTK
jgi:tRNA(fMet)-specific endonuclease VapC